MYYLHYSFEPFPASESFHATKKFVAGSSLPTTLTRQVMDHTIYVQMPIEQPRLGLIFCERLLLLIIHGPQRTPCRFMYTPPSLDPAAQ